MTCVLSERLLLPNTEKIEPVAHAASTHGEGIKHQSHLVKRVPGAEAAALQRHWVGHAWQVGRDGRNGHCVMRRTAGGELVT